MVDTVETDTILTRVTATVAEVIAVVIIRAEKGLLRHFVDLNTNFNVILNSVNKKKQSSKREQHKSNECVYICMTSFLCLFECQVHN